MMYSKDRLIRAALAGSFAGAVGCTDAPTVPPIAATQAPQQVAAWRASPDLPVIHALLGDASDRLVRPIADATMRGRLEGEVRELSTRLAAGDSAGVARSLAAVRHELETAPSGLSEPDLVTLAAALDGVRRLLSGLPVLTFSGDHND